jgi:hypothetical protein
MVTMAAMANIYKVVNVVLSCTPGGSHISVYRPDGLDEGRRLDPFFLFS